MITPLSKAQLDDAKAKRQIFYKQIRCVILPVWLKDLFPTYQIFIGGCVERGVGSSFRHKAHAHSNRKDPNFGCLCFRSIKRLGDYNTVGNDSGEIWVIVRKPSRLLLHEFAHLLAPNQWHNKTFDRRYRELLALQRKQ